MTQTSSPINFYDMEPELSNFYDDVKEGLGRKKKWLHAKYFYDEPGSELFELICATPEYYPTRTEQKILKDNAEHIAAVIGEHAYVIEPGCGSCEKIKLLLDTLQPKAYVPMDISKDFLQTSAQAISDEYPWLEVHAACIDFTQPLDLPFCPPDARKLAFFPGSSIGNFEPAQATNFMSQLADMVGPGGGLLIGIDLKKDKPTLNNAYNDREGVTAAFNLNLLERMNRELSADFDLNLFEHDAFYNDDKGRIEMHLVSQASQSVQVADTAVKFEQGESIHTESSYKYSVKEFQDMAKAAGFTPVSVWTDPDDLFSVHYVEMATA